MSAIGWLGGGEGGVKFCLLGDGDGCVVERGTTFCSLGDGEGAFEFCWVGNRVGGVVVRGTAGCWLGDGDGSIVFLIGEI